MQAFDRNHLQNDQYKNASHLSARIDLHLAFSTNPYGWFRWVFDQLQLPSEARLLEVACGRADLWRGNAARIPGGWELALTDLSSGMLADARARLTEVPRDFSFAQAEIQTLPFPAQHFDAVIANHMLYYVSDKPAAFREVLRVLKPGGTFFATTVGERHMHELVELATQFNALDSGLFDSKNLDFILENGSTQLAPFFNDIQLRRYEDLLFVTQAEPLVQYFLSGHYLESMAVSAEGLRVWLDRRIREAGGISIFKDSGIFIARKGG